MSPPADACICGCVAYDGFYSLSLQRKKDDDKALMASFIEEVCKRLRVDHEVVLAHYKSIRIARHHYPPSERNIQGGIFTRYALPEQTARGNRCCKPNAVVRQSDGEPSPHHPQPERPKNAAGSDPTQPASEPATASRPAPAVDDNSPITTRGEQLESMKRRGVMEVRKINDGRKCIEMESSHGYIEGRDLPVKDGRKSPQASKSRKKITGGDKPIITSDEYHTKFCLPLRRRNQHADLERRNNQISAEYAAASSSPANPASSTSAKASKAASSSSSSASNSRASSKIINAAPTPPSRGMPSPSTGYLTRSQTAAAWTATTNTNGGKNSRGEKGDHGEEGGAATAVMATDLLTASDADDVVLMPQIKTTDFLTGCNADDVEGRLAAINEDYGKYVSQPADGQCYASGIEKILDRMGRTENEISHAELREKLINHGEENKEYFTQLFGKMTYSNVMNRLHVKGKTKSGHVGRAKWFIADVLHLVVHKYGLDKIFVYHVNDGHGYRTRRSTESTTTITSSTYEKGGKHYMHVGADSMKAHGVDIALVLLKSHCAVYYLQSELIQGVGQKRKASSSLMRKSSLPILVSDTTLL